MLNVLNTRPAHQSGNSTRLIQAAGGNVFHLPLIEIEPISFQPIKIDDFTIFIFLSANAVAHFFIKEKNIVEKLKNKMIIAIGSATQKKLAEVGLRNAICPAVFNSEGVLAMPALRLIKYKSIVMICGENPKPILCKTLNQRGAFVKILFCYRRKPLHYDMQIVFPELLENKIDVIISTSSESFSHLLNLFHVPEHRAWLLQKTLCVISLAMKKNGITAGFSTVIQADNATDEMIVKAIL